MREPYFWRVTDKRSRAAAPMSKLLLTPASVIYSWAGKRRIDAATPEDIGLPIVCIGNLTLGGAGKTPVTAAVRLRLNAKGKRTASLSRGYRGAEEGPLRVDPTSHTAADVGDEPMMLAATGESWISKDRLEGAKAMKADGVEAIVMDDGHQNPALKKALSIVVIDAAEPFGNGHVFPKGPLREPVPRGLSRADAVVLMGEGATPPQLKDFANPVLRARLAPLAKLVPGRYVAFAGIGRPERFFDSLQKQEGVELAEAVPYPDHHVFQRSDIDYLMKLVTERGARLITTDKDHVRLPQAMKTTVLRASVEARFEDEAAFAALLARVTP
ncbi:MAG: tetraacyldisaccharide 4'-kinase [Hyphomonadaceae bacterium]|nr:tetraacyldisaccharide 4'-kinase [Hyphomonadaceae bacterium]